MEHIDRYFEGVAWKYLSAVDAEPSRSNQHEFGGLVKAGFREHLENPGTEAVQWLTRFIFLANDEDESLSVVGSTSWYDALRDSPDRGPELRLYYDANAVTEALKAGMFMIIAKTKANDLLLIFTEAESSAESQLRWFFDLNGTSFTFSAKTFDQRDERSSWSSIWILDQLGIEAEPAGEQWLEALLSRFGAQFPTTREFSAFARSAAHVSATDSPDDTIVSLMETEERLFRFLERHIVEERLREGFSDVETFISYSLSVQDRRKSRAGFAFENHLAHIFAESNVHFERGPYSEARSKPDFLFPGSTEYGDPGFPVTKLSMLGVKSTCKDRWRQALVESR